MILNIIHAILGLSIGFIIPGYILSLVLFKKLSHFDKFTLGIGLSLCVDIVLGFMLGTNVFGDVITGLTEKNIWFCLLLFSLILLFIYFIQNKIHLRVINVKRIFNISFYKNILIIFSLLILVFLTRFLLYSNNPYAGDAYEFKSLYITNQLLQTGYINKNIPLKDASYKFYTGMIIDDTLHNEGHPIFLAVLELLTKIPLELLRRFSLTTVFLVFPLYALYRLITKSSKFAPIYVLLSLLYFESSLVISGKTANVTLAWYLSLCAIYLILTNRYRLRSYLIALVFQIILFFTYKTSAISLIPILIMITYGKTITNLVSIKKRLTVFSFLKLNLPEIIFNSLIIITSMAYYFYFYPLIIRVFLERITSPLPSSLLNIISYLVISNTLLINFFMFIIIYLSFYFIKRYRNKYRQLTKNLKLLNLSIFFIYTISLLSIAFLYINNLKSDVFLATPSTNIQLIKRVIDLFFFMELLGIALIYFRKYLSSHINKLIFFWIFGSIIVFPIWYIWGGLYGFILRAVAVLVFPGSLIVANFFEHNSLSWVKNKFLLLVLIIYLISPTIYYMFSINTLAKGAVTIPEFYGLRWVSSNIDKNKVIYSDLRIAGALVPISNYTHIQLKGPNDFNGNNPYEGTNLSEELSNVWYTNSINPTTNKILTYRNINYIIQSSNYYTEGIMASNFFYKPMNVRTKEAYDTSIFFDTIYSNGKLWIYRVR